jgi:hypothetical protein
MRYVILIYGNPAARGTFEALPPARRKAGLAAFQAVNEQLTASGEMIATEALADPSLAKQVQVSDGRTVTSDGPFAEAKEHLAGFYLIDCDDIDTAIGYAARVHEAAAGVDRIEVRPVMNPFNGYEM